VGSLARALSAAEAVIGQLFVAILIARLVGLHVSRRQPGARDQGTPGHLPQRASPAARDIPSDGV
jgi:hypothetical protein